jgi:hypothetical protein
MPFQNDACMKRMMFIGFSLKKELAMARTYSFHAIPLKLQMGERLMSPTTSFLVTERCLVYHRSGLCFEVPIFNKVFELFMCGFC